MRSERSQTRPDGGAALVFVVLLMLALLGLGHGTLVTALSEAAASNAALRHFTARAAAESAIGFALGLPGGSWMDSLTVGAVDTAGVPSLGRAAGSATRRRLARESWLVQGEARLPGRSATRAARLAWAADPPVRVASLPGLLNGQQGASWALAGAVDASAPTRVDPPLDSADCAPWMAELDTRYATSPLRVTGTLPDSVGGPALGLLAFGSIFAAAPVRVSGVGTPGPAESSGVCLQSAPWGWGDPDAPQRPCGPSLPLRAASGDLTVLGGVGQGLLVVDGDLTLTAGARYFGLVIVSGSVRLDGGASLHGLVLAGAGGSVASGARVVGSACWAVRALAAQRASLGRLIPLPGAAPLGPL